MSQINWRKILDLKVEQIEDLRNAGYAYIRQGKYEIALPFFEALHVVNPKNAYDVQTLGALYVQLGNPAKALRYLDKALKIKPNHGPTLLNLTKAFFMMGNKKEGLKLAKILKKQSDPYIVSFAEALLLAFN